jgi:chemotaxis protein methyltransferase CheR
LKNYLITPTEFSLFRDLIYRVAGICLNDNKSSLIQSRLQMRLRHFGFTRYQEYYDLVAACDRSHPEIIEFINCITTNKTEFFREPHHFEFVTDTILPEIERRGLPKRLRIWHAGCSSGEEPYTMAIVLAEALGPHHNWDIRQLASDIDTRVLAHAEQAEYSRDHVGMIAEPLLQKYFLRGRGTKADYVKVKPEIRAQVTFRRINLQDASWPIQNTCRFDIVFCRNVVIYFDRETQQRLFSRYAEALRPGGYLFVGHSESLAGVSDQFEPLGHTIYRLPATKSRLEAIEGKAA